MAASVKTRLMGVACERKEDFNFLLTRYVLERLLYRLALSPHADAFFLKGGMLFAVWSQRPHRATKDIDLLGYVDDLPPFGLGQSFLHSGDEACFVGEAIEFLGCEQHRRGLAVLRDDEGSLAATQLTAPFGEVSLQFTDRNDVVGDSQRNGSVFLPVHGSVF
jgi:hypothetical protein